MDISKCSGFNCPMSKRCKRYLATSSLVWQSWLLTSPYNQQTKTCDFYLEVKDSPIAEVLKLSSKTASDIFGARSERNKLLKQEK